MSGRAGKSAEKGSVEQQDVRVNERSQAQFSGSHDSILALQRAAGNRAVTDLLRRSSGRPLDADTREEMEAKFGEDFRDVRVHADRASETAAFVAGARAVTSGRDIVFGGSFYAPRSIDGRRLLAHELVHVLQQSRGDQRPASPAAAEHEARGVGAKVSAGESATVETSAGEGAQLDPMTDEEQRLASAVANPIAVPPTTGELEIEPTAYPPVGDVGSRRPRGFEPTRNPVLKRIRAGTLEGLEPTAQPPARAPRGPSVTRQQQLEGIDLNQARAPRESFRPEMRDALQKAADADHPLYELTEPRPGSGTARQFRKITRVPESGKAQVGRYQGGETGPVVQAGHQEAFASRGSQEFVLEDADLNQLSGNVIESKGAFSAKERLMVAKPDGTGLVSVEAESLKQWERLGVVPPGTVEAAVKRTAAQTAGVKPTAEGAPIPSEAAAQTPAAAKAEAMVETPAAPAPAPHSAQEAPSAQELPSGVEPGPRVRVAEPEPRYRVAEPEPRYRVAERVTPPEFQPGETSEVEELAENAGKLARFGGKAGKVLKVGGHVAGAAGAIWGTYQETKEGIKQGQGTGEALLGAVGSTAGSFSAGPTAVVANLANTGIKAVGAHLVEKAQIEHPNDPAKVKEIQKRVEAVTGTTQTLTEILPSSTIAQGLKATGRVVANIPNLAHGDTKAVEKQAEGWEHGEAGAPLMGLTMMTDLGASVAGGEDPEHALNRVAKMGEGTPVAKAGDYLGDQTYQFINKDLPEAAEFAKKDLNELKEKGKEKLSKAWNWIKS